eukprot:GHVQ01027342.1.p1 GENE.GHVQ01027342.1~~GHVQ01027342.1.p1  ORF type:complete len:781 (+),score=119.78 GHVQ01027342.1:229-2571(+)
MYSRSICLVMSALLSLSCPRRSIAFALYSDTPSILSAAPLPTPLPPLHRFHRLSRRIQPPTDLPYTHPTATPHIHTLTNIHTHTHTPFNSLPPLLAQPSVGFQLLPKVSVGGDKEFTHSARGVRAMTSATSAAVKVGEDAATKGGDSGHIELNGAKSQKDNPGPLDQSTLPRWNLERHFPYTNPYDDKIDAEIKQLQIDAKEFMNKYKSKLSSMLPEAVIAYEGMAERIAQIDGYLFLSWSVKQTDTKLTTRQSDVKANVNELRSNYLTFFSLEIAKIDENDVQRMMSDSPQLRHYESFVSEIRKKKPFYLSEDVERALSVRVPWVSEEPVTEYLEQQLASAKFTTTPDMLHTPAGALVNLEELLNKLFNKEQSVRRASLKCLNSGLEQSMINRFAALSLNMVTGSWHIEMRERNYKTLRSSRNLSNNVPDDVVDSLLLAVRTDGVELSKRYYKLKKNVLMATQGLKEFTWADRNAPINLGKGSKIYSWEEAKDIVRSGYKKFSPTMADMFDRMVDEERIDMPAVDGKRSGAFCHGVVPAVGPFQLNNFIGDKRDVATLAHESGHGCHDILAYKQGYLQYHPPLTLAETASIFGEMIVFRDLLDKAESDEERLSMLMSKVDETINSVVRQCSFDRFEELIHTARKNGIVGDDSFCDLWMQATKEYYGEEGEIIDRYEDMDKLWAYVTHFHAVPFYVYSYAFADLLVGSLYNVYTKSSEGFESNLIQLLEAGSTKDFVSVLAPFGLNPSEPSFWKTALQSHLGSLLSQAEGIAKKLNLSNA